MKSFIAIAIGPVSALASGVAFALHGTMLNGGAAAHETGSGHRPARLHAVVCDLPQTNLYAVHGAGHIMKNRSRLALTAELSRASRRENAPECPSKTLTLTLLMPVPPRSRSSTKSSNMGVPRVLGALP